MFLCIALLFLVDELFFHWTPGDPLLNGGLYCATLEAPAMILIACRMSQRVGYAAREKAKMTASRLQFINNLEKAFPRGQTIRDTVFCIALVLGTNLITNIFTLATGVEIAGYYVHIAIGENLYYQVALIAGLTAMLLYPSKRVGIPAALAYIAGVVLQALASDPATKIELNLIPIVIFILFFGLAKRDVPAPSKQFNWAMAFTSATLFFIYHYDVYGHKLITWIGIFFAGLIMAFYYIKSRNVAVTTWAHVLLNILAVPALLFAMMVG